ncbi:MAG TPA: 2-succinyl-5-enolpyruvyl-6-hydroxy-3-cyclohexene-1-carboxylic-acid synthase [Rhabdochlamydiaceae bacterium]|jgi:2-succinyl-5-enolpyruvyl-6-hydroxy-3-cyclohexene-1-carboxylate synthase
MDVGACNEERAALLVEHLIAQGVDSFCLSPGSRSTSLALAIAHNPLAKTQVHFDERGMSFYALGMAKGLRKPVAIVTTSGTGTGNILPAVMEAGNDHVPLLVITADRPAELRECSANQTVDQTKLFSSLVRWQVDLPFSDPEFSPRYLASAIAHAVFMAKGARPGPVHLNCMFREPFFSSDEVIKKEQAPRICERGKLVASDETIDKWAMHFSNKKGLIIAGGMPWDCQIESLFDLAEKLGWPIYADILSQLRSHSHPHLISYFDPLLAASYQQPIEIALHFGNRIVSKAAAQWLQAQAMRPSFAYVHVSDYPTLLDPHHVVTHRLHAEPMDFAKRLTQSCLTATNSGWLDFWSQGNAKIKSLLEDFFSAYPQILEPGIIRYLAQSDLAHAGIFFANSMPIRDADKFFPALGSRVPMFGTRGVSGIDGNIAAATGIAQGLRKPLIALIGDLACLHDINSLALLDQAEQPVCLIVVNNSGGGIFSFFSVYEKKQAFEKFFAAAHPYTFAHAAAQFNIDYAKPSLPSEFKDLLNTFLRNKRSLLIEVTTCRSENLRIHQHLAKEAASLLQPQSEKKTLALLKRSQGKVSCAFLHGFLGAKEDWDPLCELFSGKFSCLAVDLPGHGSSPDICCDYLERLHQAIVHNSSSQPALIGYSLGGRIALQLYNKYPSSFSHLVILSAHPGIKEEKARHARLAEDLAWMQKLETQDMPTFLNEWYKQPLFRSLCAKPDLLKSLIERRSSQDPRRLSAVMHVLSVARFAPIVTFHPRTLFLHGQCDERYRALYQELPKSVSVREVASCGHAVHLEDPKRCADLIISWLEENT